MVQCDADGVNKVILIGSDHGKRRQYFEKAARDAGVCCSFYDWKNIRLIERNEDLKRCVMKIDAPEWESCRLNELDALTRQYEEWLFALSEMPVKAFWNHPMEIAELLDKRTCKRRLVHAGVAVTQMYEKTFSDRQELLCYMREKRIHQVFLKPVKGSGAAGVTALRVSALSPKGKKGCPEGISALSPKGKKGCPEGVSSLSPKGKLALYTCAALEKGELVNTKRMYRLEGSDAENYLDQLLKLDCIVEKWYRKARFQEYCYDLRVIVQDGRVDYILPRLSKGPITNLQLNNHSMELKDLALDETVIEQIADLCIRAADCYPRLHGIGMDVLLERESRKPYIIELNAQGDLLHRDIYGENRIYRRQIEILKSKYGML